MQNKTQKRGVAITPVQFGIAFTTTFLNQAGALVQIYRDGTIALNHGGTEMGQGLFIKVAQITAATLGVPLSKVRCQPTSTAVVPNTSATAASSGSDLNAMAAQNAALVLRRRLTPRTSGGNNKNGTFAPLQVGFPRPFGCENDNRRQSCQCFFRCHRCLHFFYVPARRNNRIGKRTPSGKGEH